MNAPACLRRLGLLFALSTGPVLAAPNLPEAAPDLAVTAPGQSVVVDVLANDRASLGPDIRLLNAHKPRHGKAQVENGRVRYTPNAGFTGSDQFVYMVQAPKSQPRVGTVTVNVGAGGVALTMAGQVVDEPIPGAVVTVSVGGFDFVAVADENGNYVIDIAALTGNAFVSVSAVGTSPSGGAVDFVSLVGEIARLDAEAGSDGILTLDENNQVNVTHFSTAQFVLLGKANGGRAPTSDASLKQLTQNIDIDELIELAAVIKLVVDEGYALPPGVRSPLALISDENALVGFIGALPAGVLEDTVAEVGSGAGELSGFSAGRIPSGYALVFPGDTGTIRIGIGGQLLLELGSVTASTTSGRGNLVGANFNTSPGLDWFLDGNTLVADLDSPSLGFGYQTSPGCPVPQNLQVTFRTVGLRLERIQDGAGIDYLNVTQVQERSFLDQTGSCTTPPDDTFTSSFRALGFEDGAGELPFTAGESLGTMMLSHYGPQRFVPGATGIFWIASLFDFNASQVDIPQIAPGFTWSISGGRLNVALANTVTGEVLNYQYRRYQTDGRKGEGLFTVVTRQDGARAASYNLAARVDGSLPAFTEAMLPGRWRSGFDISQFQPDLASDFGFFLRMYDDPQRSGTFESVSYLPDGTPQASFFPPVTWGVASGADAGAKEVLSYFNGSGIVGSCNVGVDPVCQLWRRRTWTPVAIDGNRVYVLERLYFQIGNPFTDAPQIIAERPNFYERSEIP